MLGAKDQLTDPLASQDYFVGAASMETLDVYYFVRIPSDDVGKLFPARVLSSSCNSEVLYFEPIANFAGRVKLILNGSVSPPVRAFLEQTRPTTYVVLTRRITPDQLSAGHLKTIEAVARRRSIYKGANR